jgi:hypothetical protein
MNQKPKFASQNEHTIDKQQRMFKKIVTTLGLILTVPALGLAADEIKQAPSSGGVSRETISYKRVAVGRTGISFPRLTHCRNGNVLRQVNEQIDEQTKGFKCESDCKSGSFQVRSKVTYADKDIFSIYASASYFCCSAYPTNDANISQTYDLQSGKAVSFEELFKNYEEDKSEIIGIAFQKQIEHSNKLIASGKTSGTSCDDDPTLYAIDHLMDSQFSYNFSKDGLQIQPDWPHVIEACSTIVTVPYARLSKFAAPGGILQRVIK